MAGIELLLILRNITLSEFRKALALRAFATREV